MVGFAVLMGPPLKPDTYSENKGVHHIMPRIRNYKKEYAEFHGKPAQVKRRAARNAARLRLSKAGRVSKGDGKDVDHKDRNPKNNSGKNLRVQSIAKNRARNSNRTNTKPGLLGKRRSILG